MFANYDIYHFGIRLKEIRLSLGYSQESIAIKANLHTDTLRKIETGKSIPRYDTLENLSHIYKINLLSILNSYKTSELLFNYYEMVDNLMASDNCDELLQVSTKFSSLIQSNEINLVNSIDLNQLSLFFEALSLSYLFDYESKKQSINIFINSIRLTNHNFSLNNYNILKYSYFELRILLAIASVLGELRHCAFSNHILEFLIASFDFSKYAKNGEKLLICKLYSIISYNHHRLNAHDLCITYAQKGIDYCISNSLMAYLPLLLSRKGISMYQLELPNFHKFLEQAISLLEIQGKQDQVLIYKNTFKEKYRIDICLS